MQNSSYPISREKAEKLRNSKYINELREKVAIVSKTINLKGTPSEIWETVSYTDFLNLLVGLNTTVNFYLKTEYGGTWMHAETKSAGLAVAYEELPYEWEKPHYYRVERVYSKGPLKYLEFHVKLKESGENTELTCSINYVTSLPNFIIGKIINKELLSFIPVFEKLANKLQKGEQPLTVFFNDDLDINNKVKELSEKWVDFEMNPAIRLSIADFILKAPERLSYRIKPLEIAKAYNLDPLEVLKFCLRLSREEELHLMWDCRCPSCKGPKESFNNLAELKNSAYCETCAIAYGLAFDQNLELTFTPDKKIRKVSEKYFCAGSPANTPHISWQHNLFDNEERTFYLNLSDGYYVIRSLSSSTEFEFEFGDDGLPELKIEIRNNIEIPEINEYIPPIKLQKGAKLSIKNYNSYEITLMFENILWNSLAITAAKVQAVQEFHDLFPDQVLATDEKMPLSSQIFLEAKLIIENDSDELIKDNLYNIKQIINQHEGAAIFTGSNTMQGIFSNEFDALSAAWLIRNEFIEINLISDYPVKISLGIAAGACEVFQKEEKLSYSGEGVDLSKKACELSNNSGIVILESLLLKKEMDYFLDNPELEFSKLDTEDQEKFVFLHLVNEMVEI